MSSTPQNSYLPWQNSVILPGSLVRIHATGLYWNKLGYIIGASSNPQNKCALVDVVPIIAYPTNQSIYAASPPPKRCKLNTCTITRLLLVQDYLPHTSSRVVSLPKMYQRALAIARLPPMMKQLKTFSNSSLVNFQIINLIQSYTRWNLMGSAGQFSSMESR